MTDAVREAVAGALQDTAWADLGWHGRADAILSAIAALPLSARLAYARGLATDAEWRAAGRVSAAILATHDDQRDYEQQLRYIGSADEIDGAAVLASAKETGA